MSDDALGEHWRPLVDAVDDALLARVEDPSLPLHELGRFQLEELIGFGGMGLVFKAYDPRLERTIALKLWKLDAKYAEAALQREAKLQARVSHPNVVTIFETGKIGADVYLAMEYVRGMDLRRWVQKHVTPWEVTLALLVHAGRGLAAVHRQELVHADFKPENILVSKDGRLLVADFGVARALDVQAGAPGAVSSGRGTKAYMAPERLERRWTDTRSDQFSFCVTVWECIYGEFCCSVRRGPSDLGSPLNTQIMPSVSSAPHTPAPSSPTAAMRVRRMSAKRASGSSARPRRSRPCLRSSPRGVRRARWRLRAR